MAIAPLQPSPPLAAANGVRQVHAVLDRCTSVDDLTGYAASALLADVDRAVTRLQALKLSLVALVDKSDIASDAGMTGTAAWLASRSRRDGASAAREVRLATALDNGLSATKEALREGHLTTEHAMVIAIATQQLPSGLNAAERPRPRCHQADPARQPRRHHHRPLHRADARRADPQEVIQQMASPRRFSQQAARDARGRALMDGSSLTSDQVAEATWDAFRAEDLDWSQKYGRAFVELLEHLPTDHLSGKVNAIVIVSLDHDQLKASLGAAHLDTGHDLSASEARRLACGAGLVAAVLGGESQLLDLGRTQRFFTEAQRVALSMTYDSCAADDCDRPYAWTEQHHQDPWAPGGRTDLDNAVPLCGFHHRRMHHPGFHHQITREAGGRKRVTVRRRT